MSQQRTAARPPSIRAAPAYLHVTAGVARFGSRDGTIIEVHPGQTLYAPPGEEHWHAAAAGSFMEHIAILEGDDGAENASSWGEHVTDAEYEGC